jgi:hypothetical protein
VAGELVIPPHHDPACWGCGTAPAGIRLPQPASEGLNEYEAWFSFDERHQAAPGLVHGGLVDERGRRLHVNGSLTDGGSEVLAEARAAFLHVPLEHFLATPEGRSAADAWKLKSKARKADKGRQRFRSLRPGEMGAAC